MHRTRQWLDLTGLRTAATVLTAIMFAVSGLCRVRRPHQDRLMPLTGGLASNGKAILTAYQMWEEDVNAKGGLLGRPVKLVFYDDQSNPSLVPGIYAKLFDIDKVDLVITSYGTNLSVPSLPVVVPRNYVLMGLFALAVNENFNYPYYFSMFPAGPDAIPRILARLFRDRQGAGAEHAGDRRRRHRFRQEGRRRRARECAQDGIQDRSTTAAIRRARSTSPRSCGRSRPPTRFRLRGVVSDRHGRDRAAGTSEIRLEDQAVRRWHGRPAICRAQDPARRAAQQDRQLRLLCAGADGAVPRHRPLSRALPGEGRRRSAWMRSVSSCRPLRLCQRPGCSHRLLRRSAAWSRRSSDYLKTHKFQTIVGDVEYAPNGEWKNPRVLWVQYQGVKGNGLDQFKKAGTQVIVYPKELSSGSLQFPYAEGTR